MANNSDDQSAAWESEKKLDDEEKTLIGNEAEDHNLTGSTTYVTLPDQGDDQNAKSGKSGKSGQQSKTSGNKSSDTDRGSKRS